MLNVTYFVFIVPYLYHIVNEFVKKDIIPF